MSTMKFVHSADWQLGARFTRFGAKARDLREARIQTLQKAIDEAQNHRAEMFLIAGDLFADNQVERALVERVLNLFQNAPDLAFFILPGNHDPYTGPGCVWEHAAFKHAPPNVTLLREPKVIEIKGGWLLASPLRQKVSTIDPSLKLAELAKDLPPDCIRIGITHGALAIPGEHQPNDFPVALNAASRAGLDYLALGHWHTHQVCDNGRLIMSGTPEPDDFNQTEAGCVWLVEIETHGATPKLEKIPVATLQWESLELDFVDLDASRQALEAKLDQLRPRAKQTVIRVTLRGTVSPGDLETTQQRLEATLEPFLVWKIQNETYVEFKEAELAELQRQHPLLAMLVKDLMQMEHFCTGVPVRASFDAPAAIGLSEAQQMLKDAGIQLGELDSEFFRVAYRMLAQKLREAGA